MKPTYKNIAKHFNIKAYQTVSKMHKDNPKMYKALRKQFEEDMKVNQEKDKK